jgi:DNA invertase Pin-like site-specific DNA recombinase
MHEVADFFGYTIQEVDDEDFAKRPGMREIFQKACAHLFPYQNRILINGELPPLRKRTCGFHELGHATLPWHSRLNFACAAYTLGLGSHRRLERQAFLCGAELQMPHHLFAADAADLPLGIAAIKTLARWYLASLETTAIRYVQTHLHCCALVVLEASRGQPLRRRTPGHQLSHGSTLPFTTWPTLSSVGEEDIPPLRVKYSIKAPRFPHYIPAMKVVLYARVSSDRQAEKDLSITAQLKALRKYAVERDWEVLKEFVDEAESARSANRPAFKEMISLARQRHKSFAAILVWKLSRFARNREDSIIYKSLLRKHGVSVVSINEQVDETPAGKLLEGMIEVIDEFYSTNLAQDTIRGMKENATRGYYNGGIPPIGYKTKKVVDGSAKRNVLEPDEQFAPIIRRIFQMYADRMGAKDIVKVLNNEGLRTNRGKPWSKTVVYYILSNEVYIGTLSWGKAKPGDASDTVRIENNHPPLIDREVSRKFKASLNNVTPGSLTPEQSIAIIC